MSKTKQTSTRFAFVHAQWHEDIVQNASESFLAEMASQGYGPGAIDILKVPGVFEIPLCAKKLARSGRYAAIVCCGLVVDGGIYRHEFVSATVVNALMALQLEFEVPMVSVVLTPQHFHEHEAHRTFFTAHFKIKGEEAARTCLAMAAQVAVVDALCNAGVERPGAWAESLDIGRAHQ
jgi:6,7-dimethyl-8-ribityllumazine synthase